jgi:heme exporter protein D
MNWGSLAEFFAMGGYGPYVWGAYAVTFGLIALESFMALARHRRASDRLELRELLMLPAT